MDRFTYYLMKGSENDGWYLYPTHSSPEAIERLAAYENLGTPKQLAARVEVVRCVDCEHGDWAGKRAYCMMLGIKQFGPDGFCSYGERRED